MLRKPDKLKAERARLDSAVVHHPDDAGDPGSWAISADHSSSCSSCSVVVIGFARGNKSSDWKLLLLLRLRTSFNLSWVKTLVRRTNV